MSTPSHDTDFFGWTRQQAQRLRTGHLEQLDVSNLIDEIEDLGQSQIAECIMSTSSHDTDFFGWTRPPGNRPAGTDFPRHQPLQPRTNPRSGILAGLTTVQPYQEQQMAIPNPHDYETDIVAWSRAQARWLKAGRVVSTFSGRRSSFRSQATEGHGITRKILCFFSVFRVLPWLKSQAWPER